MKLKGGGGRTKVNSIVINKYMQNTTCNIRVGIFLSIVVNTGGSGEKLNSTGKSFWNCTRVKYSTYMSVCMPIIYIFTS